MTRGTSDEDSGAPRPRSWPSPLRTLLENPIDAGYVEAAERRAERGEPRPRYLRVATVVTVAVVGVGLALAGRELTIPDGARDPVRAELSSQIIGAQGAGDALRDGNAELQSDVNTLRDEVVADAPGAVADQARGARAAAGQYAVTGPALVITVTDATISAAQGDDGLVRDSDLQVIVNGLWSAGAEAISIDDERLGATTAVRAAGRAILVNLEATSSPYRIVALGDPGALRDALSGTTAGQHLSLLASDYGIGVTMEESDSETVPALPPRSPSFATALTPDGATSGDDAPPSEGDD
jgi:uncharacterized protein YlxW (UPF0749 family)